MIYDNIKNCAQYESTCEGFKKGFDFLKKAVSENLPEGRYEIDGTDVYAFIQQYTSKLETESSFEAHKRYIDIQYILSGVEVMDFSDASLLTVKTEYSDEKDVMFFDDCDNSGRIIVCEGEYGIFFPWDAHKPGMCKDSKPDTVRKIVVKVKCD